MTVASVTTFVLAHAHGLPQGFWAVITALIVTQSSVGGSLKAAADRFAGSVFGVVYGGAVAFAIPHQGGASMALALVVAIAPLSLAATFSAGFRIAPITAIIVLLSTSRSTLGPLAFTVDRILEVGLGCGIGLLISLLVAAARASQAVLRTAAELAQLLADQLTELAPLPEQDAVEQSDLPLKTRRALNRLEAQVSEAQRERRSRLTSALDPAPLFRTLLRLRHDVVVLRRAVRKTEHSNLRDDIAQSWAAAAKAGARVLRDLGSALQSQTAPGESAILSAAIAAYHDKTKVLGQCELTRDMPANAAGRLFWIAFSLEQFRRNLDDLEQRAREFAHSDGTAPC